MKSHGRDGEAAFPTTEPRRTLTEDSYQLDDLRIDVRTRCVLRQGVDLGVTGLSFDLLLTLVRASPALVTFDELMQRVWPGVIVSPETLTQRVKLLRQGLGDSAEQPRYILAVRGHGYRLREAATPGAVRLAAQEELTPNTGRPLRWIIVGGAIVVAAAAIGATWWLLTADTATHVVVAPSLQAEARQSVRQAQSVVNGSSASFLAAITLYDEALARDPDSIAALSGRAMNRAALVWNGSPLSRGLDLAQKDAERALMLDPKNPDAASALASILSMRGNWLAAENQFQAAISAHPRNAEIRARYALSLLLPTGQLRKATAEATLAQNVSSDSGGFTAAMLAFVHGAQGADAEAVRFADLMVARAGDPRQVAHIYIAAATRKGRYVEAADRAVAVLPLDIRDAGGEAALRQSFAALEHPSQQPAALAALRKLTAAPVWEQADTWGRWPVLFLLAKLGATDELYDEMSWMLRKEGDRFPQIIAIGSLWSSDLRIFRRDRRFSTLVERLGLVDYWRRVGPPDGCKLTPTGLEC